MSGLVPETPRRPDSWFTMRPNRSGVIPRRWARNAFEPGVEVPAAGAHDQAGGGGEPHRRVQAPALSHRGQARARAEVRQDDPSPGLRRPGNPRQLLHEIRVGEPVEPVATDAESPVPAAGSARSGRSSGSLRWKPVSKQATCGTPGMVLPNSSISAISPGRCSGSRGLIRRNSSSISALTSLGSMNRSPPWTTRAHRGDRGEPRASATRSITSRGRPRPPGW